MQLAFAFANVSFFYNNVVPSFIDHRKDACEKNAGALSSRIIHVETVNVDFQSCGLNRRSWLFSAGTLAFSPSLSFRFYIYECRIFALIASFSFCGSCRKEMKKKTSQTYVAICANLVRQFYKWLQIACHQKYGLRTPLDVRLFNFFSCFTRATVPWKNIS